MLCFIMCAISCSTEKSLVWVEKPVEFVNAETSLCDTTFLNNMRMVRLENKGSQSAINNTSKIIEIDDLLYIYDRILNQITNKVVLVGKPLHNQKINNLFFDIISK